jgi:hypothetical protein
MQSIKIPFSFSNGSVANTTDAALSTQQRIIDVLVTIPGERAINTGYGVGIQGLLYEAMDALVFDDFKSDAISKLNEVIDSGKVLDITISTPESEQMAYIEDSAIEVKVVYSVPSFGVRNFTFNVSSDI